jgi:adenylate kinase family enzyme
MSSPPANPPAPTGVPPDPGAVPDMETRRLDRLASVARVRIAAEEIALRLNNGIMNRLSFYQDGELIQLVKDPCLAFARISRTHLQCVAMEERLDENAETREKRLAAELAAREQAILNEQSGREREAVEQREEDKKITVRRALRDIHREVDPNLPFHEVEHLLDDLFDTYEAYDDYDGDPAEILARICAQAGFKPKVLPNGELAPLDAKEPVDSRTVKAAAEYLTAAAEQNDEEEPAEPQAKGTGPP